MNLTAREKEILRSLAARLGELAARPENVERKRLWIKHNTLQGERPMFLADQLPWNELDPEGLKPMIADPYWNGVAYDMRCTLWKAENLKTDMVIDPYVKVPLPVSDSGLGITADIDRLRLDATGAVDSQHMNNQIREPEDIERITTPAVTLDTARRDEIAATADELFRGILPWRFTGTVLHSGIWDTISFWMGVDNCYVELLDRPEMIHALMERMTQCWLARVDQLNALKAYDTCQNLCHCSHTYMPDDDYDRDGTTENGWTFGMAQLFTSVSPRITQEFEVDYMKRLFARFKNVYYGCCDRLDDRMEMVASLPNVRKISCSPWSDREVFAEKLPASIIMSNKPSPAMLLGDTMDEDLILADVARTVKAARDHGKTVELILKDVSTVLYQPQRLQRFCEIAMEEIAK